MCQGLLPSRRHIEKREDPGDEVVEIRKMGKCLGIRDIGKTKMGFGHQQQFWFRLQFRDLGYFHLIFTGYKINRRPQKAFNIFT